MKVACPVCGRIGVFQVYGNSKRVIHYEWRGDKRVFWAHKLPATVTETPVTDCNRKDRNALLHGGIECSGRDLDPGRRLERPAYLTGLYYRSAFLANKCSLL